MIRVIQTKFREKRRMQQLITCDCRSYILRPYGFLRYEKTESRDPDELFIHDVNTRMDITNGVVLDDAGLKKVSSFKKNGISENVIWVMGEKPARRSRVPFMFFLPGDL